MVHAATLDALRRHVVRRAEQLPVLRQVGGIEPGDAEVGDLHPPFGIDDEVRRFDVAVDHPLAVGVIEPLGNLLDDVDDALERHRLALLQELLEVRPLHVLHGDEGDPLLARFDDVVDGDDVRMRQNPGALRLADEACPKLLHLGLVDGVADAERLQRHATADQRIARQVDDAHGALAELRRGSRSDRADWEVQKPCRIRRRSRFYQSAVARHGAPRSVRGGPRAAPRGGPKPRQAHAIVAIPLIRRCPSAPALIGPSPSAVGSAARPWGHSAVLRRAGARHPEPRAPRPRPSPPGASSAFRRCAHAGRQPRKDP